MTIRTNKRESAMSLEQRLGRRIKAMRALRGVTQSELAAACHMSNQTISKMELGKSDFRIGTLREIEKVLNCTLLLVPNEDIFFEEE